MRHFYFQIRAEPDTASDDGYHEPSLFAVNGDSMPFNLEFLITRPGAQRRLPQLADLTTACMGAL